MTIFPAILLSMPSTAQFLRELPVRAAHETWHLLSPRVSSIVTGLALNLLAIALYAASKKGFGSSVTDKLHFFLMVLISNVGVVVLIFVINLSRAPYLLYRDEAAQLDQSIGRERLALSEKADAERQRDDALKQPTGQKTVVVHGACKLATEQINPARVPQPCTGPSSPTLQDRVLTNNAHLTESDRDRFSNALSEFEDSLSQGEGLLYKISDEGNRLARERQDKTIAKNAPDHQTTLTTLAADAWKYQKAFPAVRSKWGDKFPEQTEYIFGDNPDNNGPNSLINAAEGLRNFLVDWSAIPNANKDQVPILDLLGVAQNEFHDRLNTFGKWRTGCKTRLAEMRTSIR